MMSFQLCFVSYHMVVEYRASNANLKVKRVRVLCVCVHVLLHCRSFCFVQSCLQELKRQFPDSHRVTRLAGMRLEALER